MKQPIPKPDVLVIYDDAGFRHCLAALLGREGFIVETADRPQDALAYMRGNGLPRFIILGPVLPEIDGCNFLQVWRHDAELRDVPVVIFTPTPQQPGTDPVAWGVNAALETPFDPSKVIDTVRQYCRSFADSP
jgi:CheY-like chemotaxis protein